MEPLIVLPAHENSPPMAVVSAEVERSTQSQPYLTLEAAHNGTYVRLDRAHLMPVMARLRLHLLFG